MVLEFHEDNETAVGAMKTGYSPTMKYLGRTHGVCLRWLAERFRDPLTHLFYERSALQAADVYTKAFTVPAEWDRVTRLINVIDPKRFWEDTSRTPLANQMPNEHKGDVHFTYWTSNPWHGLGLRKLPKEALTAEAAVCIARTPPAKHPCEDKHVPWVVAPTVRSALACKVHSEGGSCSTYSSRPSWPGTTADETEHCSSEYFEESPDYDPEDYGSTAAPDSDTESLSEFMVDGASDPLL